MRACFRDPFRSPWVWLPPCTALALLAAILATGANRPLFLFLNHAGHALGERFWLHLTVLGDGAIALALVLPCIKRSPRAFWAALVAAVVATLWTQATKQLVDVARPLAVLDPGSFHHAGPALRRVSFPSGHSAAAFAIAGIWVMGLSGRPGRWMGRALLRVLLLALAALVALSRVMVGVHWPVDILWGMLGGWLGAWTGLAMHGRWGWRTTNIGGWLAGLLLLGLSAALLVSRHVGIPAVMPMQRAIASVCLAWGAWEMACMLRSQWRGPPWRLEGWRRTGKRSTDG